MRKRNDLTSQSVEQVRNTLQVTYRTLQLYTFPIHPTSGWGWMCLTSTERVVQIGTLAAIPHLSLITIAEYTPIHKMRQMCPKPFNIVISGDSYSSRCMRIVKVIFCMQVGGLTHHPHQTSPLLKGPPLRY